MEAVRREMPKLSPEEEAKMRDNALKFAQCMREHGIDMPDPTFDDHAVDRAMAIRGGSETEELTPFDADKFNEAAGECSEDGGPTRSASRRPTERRKAVGRIRIRSAGSEQVMRRRTISARHRCARCCRISGDGRRDRRPR